jgi:two-component system response regulator YesN
MRIVIVEDEIKIREGMSKLIEKHTRHQVIGEAKNGEEGIELILRLKPDLVITDIRMPLIDGLEMLTKLQELGSKTHSVILSGYSEFEYAKKAIHIGVSDYLLKPITLEDVQELLEKIEKKLLEEQIALKGTPQSCIRDAILGSMEYDEETLNYICGFRDKMSYIMLLGYIGGARATYSSEYIEKTQLLHKRFPNAIFYTFHVEATKEIVTLIAGEISYEEIIEYFERRFLLPMKGKEGQALWSIEPLGNTKELPQTYKRLRNRMRYGLSIDNNILLTQEVVQHYPKKEYRYPIEIENKIRTNICNGAHEKLEECEKEFFAFMNKNSYEPSCIVDGYMRLYTATANLLQEIDTKAYEALRNINTLNLMGEAKTRTELEKAYSAAIQLLMNTKEKREDIRNYTIKRTINYIRDHFNEGITLEEVALKLNITPEYLSTLFNKELGMNFSIFLKDFRLSHAKRLLSGTDRKIYEIASEVGYSDSKYFNRVFKEKYGISPGEFRQQFISK